MTIEFIFQKYLANPFRFFKMSIPTYKILYKAERPVLSVAAFFEEKSKKSFHYNHFCSLSFYKANFRT
jgi:hypothetical protein